MNTLEVWRNITQAPAATQEQGWAQDIALGDRHIQEPRRSTSAV